MTLSPQVVQLKDMTEKERAYLDRTYPGLNLSGKPKKTQVVKAKSKTVSTGKFKQMVSRPWYHIILWLLVAFCAYVYLGVGWTLRAIGESLLRGGQWLHEYKWKLGVK